MKNTVNDTICAIATAPGTGGVGIIRVSGSNALAIACKLFTSKNTKTEDFCPSMLYYGKLDAGSFSDSCMCVYFKAPHSFTGEDTVEFHCHGGTALLGGILRAVIDSGARIAECGEFTRRAFINGKLDLSECEGLIDLINAESEAAVNAANSLLRGELSERIKTIQDKLKDILSYLEVAIDYSEEDVEQQKREETAETLGGVRAELEKLAATFSAGSRIREGVAVTLCGRPNVGKSSLFNALIGYKRAIVTEIAGTTRDVIDGQYTYNGVLFKVCDTAGIRQGGDVIENMGIEISKSYIESSDISVFVSDGKLTASDREILSLLSGKKHITVLNKSDIIPEGEGGEYNMRVSALTGQNIEILKKSISEATVGKGYTGGLLLTNYRHYDAVKRAEEILSETISEIDSLYVDMLAQNVRLAWETLGEITGENSIESIIDNIFSRFCLGK